jgi:hypothetical protein
VVSSAGPACSSEDADDSSLLQRSCMQACYVAKGPAAFQHHKYHTFFFNNITANPNHSAIFLNHVAPLLPKMVPTHQPTCRENSRKAVASGCVFLYGASGTDKRELFRSLARSAADALIQLMVRCVSSASSKGHDGSGGSQLQLRFSMVDLYHVWDAADILDSKSIVHDIAGLRYASSARKRQPGGAAHQQQLRGDASFSPACAHSTHYALSPKFAVLSQNGESKTVMDAIDTAENLRIFDGAIATNHSSASSSTRRRPNGRALDRASHASEATLVISFEVVDLRDGSVTGRFHLVRLSDTDAANNRNKIGAELAALGATLHQLSVLNKRQQQQQQHMTNMGDQSIAAEVTTAAMLFAPIRESPVLMHILDRAHVDIHRRAVSSVAPSAVQNALQGIGSVELVCCVDSSEEAYVRTLSACQFARRATIGTYSGVQRKGVPDPTAHADDRSISKETEDAGTLSSSIHERNDGRERRAFLSSHNSSAVTVTSSTEVRSRDDSSSFRQAMTSNSFLADAVLIEQQISASSGTPGTPRQTKKAPQTRPDDFNTAQTTDVSTASSRRSPKREDDKSFSHPSDDAALRVLVGGRRSLRSLLFPVTEACPAAPSQTPQRTQATSPRRDPFDWGASNVLGVPDHTHRVPQPARIRLPNSLAAFSRGESETSKPLTSLNPPEHEVQIEQVLTTRSATEPMRSCDFSATLPVGTTDQSRRVEISPDKQETDDKESDTENEEDSVEDPRDFIIRMYEARQSLDEERVRLPMTLEIHDLQQRLASQAEILRRQSCELAALRLSQSSKESFVQVANLTLSSNTRDLALTSAVTDDQTRRDSFEAGPTRPAGSPSTTRMPLASAPVNSTVVLSPQTSVNESRQSTEFSRLIDHADADPSQGPSNAYRDSRETATTSAFNQVHSTFSNRTDLEFIAKQREDDRATFNETERRLSLLVAEKSRRIDSLERLVADLDAKLAIASSELKNKSSPDETRIQLRFARQRYETDMTHIRNEMVTIMDAADTKEKQFLHEIAELRKQNAHLRNIHDTSLSDMDSKLANEVLTMRRLIETMEADHRAEVIKLTHEVEEHRRHVRRLQQHQSECAAADELQRVSEAIRVKSQAEEKVREATRLLVSQLEQERRQRSSLQDELLVLKLRLEEYESKFQFLDERVAPAVADSVTVLEEQAHIKRRVARQYRQLALEHTSSSTVSRSGITSSVSTDLSPPPKNLTAGQ